MKMHKTQVLALAFALFFAIPATQAEDLKPMPKPKTMSVEKFAAKSASIRRSLTEDPTVDMSFSLPNSFTERPFDQLKNQRIGGQMFGELISFVGAPYGDVRPYFKVSGLQVPREITPRLWLITNLLSHNQIIRSFHQIDDRTVEAMYVSFENNVSMGVRVKAWLQGPRMLVAEYGIPIEGFDALVDEQTYSMNSIKLLREVKNEIEARTNDSFWNVLNVSYPKSWLVTKKEKPSVNRIAVEMTNPDENSHPQGKIEIDILTTRNIEDRTDTIVYPITIPEQLDRIKAEIAQKKLGMDERLSSTPAQTPLKTTLAVTEIYNLRPKFSAYETSKKDAVTHELWITVLRTAEQPERAIVISMITPARGTELYKWAINAQAYKILLDSLALPSSL